MLCALAKYVRNNGMATNRTSKEQKLKTNYKHGIIKAMSSRNLYEVNWEDVEQHWKIFKTRIR